MLQFCICSSAILLQLHSSLWRSSSPAGRLKGKLTIYICYCVIMLTMPASFIICQLLFQHQLEESPPFTNWFWSIILLKRSTNQLLFHHLVDKFHHPPNTAPSSRWEGLPSPNCCSSICWTSPPTLNYSYILLKKFDILRLLLYGLVAESSPFSNDPCFII